MTTSDLNSRTSFEELLLKIDIQLDDAINSNKILLDLIKLSNNSDFNALLQKIYSNETVFSNIDEFKSFLLKWLEKWLAYIQSKLDWKKTKKDDTYYQELNDMIAFEEKYAELFSFSNEIYEKVKARISGTKKETNSIL